MFCEVEFLGVGEPGRAGDAIIVRYGDNDRYQLMAVDGGITGTGAKMAKHLRQHFGNDAMLSHVVLTHADANHASGLPELLREIPVANLWLHIPWQLSADAISFFKDKNWTPDALSDVIKTEYDIIAEIVELASQADIPIRYPFQGHTIGPFTVLSPSKDAYLYLLPQFDRTPEPDHELIEDADMWIGRSSTGALALIFDKAVATLKQWLPETWFTEQLKDGSYTTASNESSVILYADCGNDRRILLTGDAGIHALQWAAQYAAANGLILQDFRCVQIPNHGSRNNVGPSVLNDLIGPIQPEGTKRLHAYASAPKGDPTHPRKIVTNAFTRRGARVVVTEGREVIYYGGFPPRSGYDIPTPMPLSDSVEEYD